ncbi:PREDICTED: placenta-expressed transcript 1 protein-like [Gavialis gangeticus]|uniref:placenta-expressed transcript 1 protein-like n=1 Tax=Gavialis gangeticus TaxID=94835 RepID=UPI00092F8F17|nr:PREDICTED: placenta-expressed transcript 1 protein-like [Gavialis gangeticus]
MAVLPFALQFVVLLGALVSPAYSQLCDQVTKNGTQRGFYTLNVYPTSYKANTSYTVIISNIKNSTAAYLQASIAPNSSVGRWEAQSCSNGQWVEQPHAATENIKAKWLSPDATEGPVEIKVYVTFSNGSVLYQMQTLNYETGAVTGTRSTTYSAASSFAVTRTQPTTYKAVTNSMVTKTQSTTNKAVSGSMASLSLVAAVQFLTLFATSKLLS